MRARVAAIFRTPAKGALPQRVAGPCMVHPWGLEGDYRAVDGGPRAKAQRVLLVVGAENVSDLGLSPGDLREQVVLEGMDPDTAPLGTTLSAGSVRLRLAKRCAPCATLAGYLGEPADSLIARTADRRGTFAEVLDSGPLEEGCPVEVIVAV